MVPDAEIVQKLATQTVVQAVPDLVSMAVAIGGPRADNTTALAISWQGADNAQASGPNVISTQLLPEDQVSSTISNVAAEVDPERRSLRRRRDRKGDRRDQPGDREIVPIT